MKYFVVKALLVLMALVTVSYTGIKRDGIFLSGENKTVAFIIELEGTSNVPPVTTDARGLALIRVTPEMQLHSRVMVHRLDESKDGRLTGAQIHTGAAGVNGPVLIKLAASPSDFDKDVVQQLTEAQYDALLNQAVYINVLTTLRPPGMLRGQLR